MQISNHPHDETPPNSGAPAPPLTETPSAEEQRRQTRMVVSLIAAAVFLLILVGGSVYFLIQPTTPTDKIRDIFIIFMALESLLLGLALVVLIIQLARLINLLQNEIKPILDSTNETANTLRGTVMFLSDNLVEPVVKINEYLAAMKQARDFLRFFKR
jgi:hypothetical protein